MSQTRLGIDIGGTGIKYALVDLDDGTLVTERTRMKTPQPATPENMSEALSGIVTGLDYEGPIGIAFPAVIWDGEVFTANNIDQSWIGRSAQDIFTEATERDISMLNDADAAALAEATFGAARGVSGLIVMITFGTGIGSGMVVDGELVPNIELGVIELDGHWPAELYFSAKARKTEDLSWDEWGGRANRYLTHVNHFLNPRLIIVGGGVSKGWDQFAHRLDTSLPLKRAAMGNGAGIVGAALASRRSQSP